MGAVRSGNGDGGSAVIWFAGTVLGLRATYGGLSGTLALPIAAVLNGDRYGMERTPKASLANVSVDTAYTWTRCGLELRGAAGLSLPTAQDSRANSLYAGY